ncbi:Copine-5,Copine-9,Copine-2,Copine-8 [Lepeophtheirus salmonis]|uniref:Copine-5,Copine-9,Copine-2,Copine-8 n=1 Tax=Lepeophtheirus salmonis TaxID=72036 RepID=A0A7R8CX97_LEPSM|nr:Copine-5,Copine-9,Copine-2,Copine-8 [Lepeophtheirus salmonis]CAF2959292.1 Copine-5,Copine-9,Copine-2,Copine-8 [Lepeophtheirus salmonis]
MGQDLPHKMAVEDMFIRKFMNGTWPDTFQSEIIIKRTHNLIRIAGITNYFIPAKKMYFLIGYTEEMLSLWLKCPPFHIDVTSDNPQNVWQSFSKLSKNLADMDVFDKSDPFCVVYLKEFNGSNTWLEMGRTEHINNNLNPSWVKKIVLEYRFEERQMLRFDVYDYDIKGSSNLDNHDFLGTCSCSLGEIVTGGSMGAVCSIPLQKKKNGSKLLISVEEMQVNKEETVWKVYAKNCDKKDFFGKSDPFLLISKSTPEGNGKYIPVHKTEVVKNTLNPIWKQFTIPIASLCNGDYLRPLMFEVSDWNRNGTEDFIGSVNLTLREIRDKRIFSVDLINDSKRKKKGF